MNERRVGLGESGYAGAFDAREEARLPVAPPRAGHRVEPRSAGRFVMRMVRNAAVAVALMTLPPITLVMLNGERLLHSVSIGTMSRRVTALEPMRALGVRGDPSITPMQAGLALNALQTARKSSPGFRAVDVPVHPVATWRTLDMAPDMFPSARQDLYNGPSSQHILEVAAKGFSASEMEYLRALATAPIWQTYDIVARAPAVDIIGGQLQVPFGDDAYAAQRPLPSYKETRELANAAVSRAAWHLARGQRDSAQAVLQSIVSYGFVFIDNSSTAVDELIGQLIVGVGRDALQRFYTIEHDPRASLPALRRPTRGVNANPPPDAGVPVDELRRRLIARMDNPALPRGERMEALRVLSMSSCSNVRELMFGPRADVVNAIARARTTLARYPSERALVDLESRLPKVPYGDPYFNPLQSLAISVATIPGVVLHNPRLAACSMLIVGR